MKTTQIAALILGILGGLFGIGSALGVMGLAGLGGALGVAGSEGIAGRGVIALLFSILGLIGAGIVGNNPKISGILMLVSAIVGFLIIFPFYILASALFLAGGILALISKRAK